MTSVTFNTFLPYNNPTLYLLKNQFNKSAVSPISSSNYPQTICTYHTFVTFPNQRCENETNIFIVITLCGQMQFKYHLPCRFPIQQKKGFEKPLYIIDLR